MFILLVCLMLGLSIVAIGQPSGTAIFGLPTLLVCVLFSFFVQWLIFVPSYLVKTERFYDLSGSLSFIGVIVIALAYSAPVNAYQITLGAMVILWAIRLGIFLSLRIHRDGKDDRFIDIKRNKYSFFVAWTIQGLWVLISAACVLVVISTNTEKSDNIGIWDQACFYMGSLLWLLGVSIESIADWQKRTHKIKSPNTFIQSGLWSRSQHPNYFGEICLWTGLAIASLPFLHSWQYFSLMSPVFIFVLLTKISGIPMLDTKANIKWGKDKNYQAYVKRTPVLMLKLFSSKSKIT